MNKSLRPLLLSRLQTGLLNRAGLIIAADVIVFFILYHTLPFEPSVVLGLSILVFIAVLWLTEALHVTATAILIPIIAVLFGVFDTQMALNNFANSIVFLFFGGFALASALRIQGLDQMLANTVLRLAKGRMKVAILMLFGTTALLAMWISNAATTAMMLPQALGILSKVQAQKKTYVFVLLGIAYSATIGGMTTVLTPPNAIAAAQVGLTFTEWMRFGLPTTLVLLPLTVAVMYLVLKPDLSGRFAVHSEPVAWDQGKITTLIIFALTVLMWIFSKPLNALLGGYAGFDTLIALGAVVMLMVTRVARWQDIEKTTEWGVFLLFGGGFCLSNILKSTGTSVFLANTLYVWVTHSSIAVIILVIATFVVFLTEFASNTATTALLVPVFVTVPAGLGLSPIIMSVLVAIAASCAFMLPVATLPNAIVYGSGHIKQRDMIRVGLVLNIVCAGALTLLAVTLWA